MNQYTVAKEISRYMSENGLSGICTYENPRNANSHYKIKLRDKYAFSRFVLLVYPNSRVASENMVKIIDFRNMSAKDFMKQYLDNAAEIDYLRRW